MRTLTLAVRAHPIIPKATYTWQLVAIQKPHSPLFPITDTHLLTAQPQETSAGDDFLAREKALLGDDADQFATGNDNAAFVEDGDDDLLGGGGNDNEEVTEFESSFPAIDIRNEVSSHLHDRCLSFRSLIFVRINRP